MRAKVAVFGAPRSLVIKGRREGASPNFVLRPAGDLCMIDKS